MSMIKNWWRMLWNPENVEQREGRIKRQGSGAIEGAWKLPEGFKYKPIINFPLPQSLHWLGEDGGREPNGCVLYFRDMAECLNFIEWMNEMDEERRHD